MQVLTFVLHIAAIVSALVMYRHAGKWKYFVIMFVFYNAVGFVYYVGVFFIPGFLGHIFSQTRAFLQSLGWLVYSISLYRGGKDES